MKSINWILYRKSQYATLDDALKFGATSMTKSIPDLKTAETALRAAVAAVELLEHRSSTDDFRIILTVDGQTLPECALIDSIKTLRRNA